MCIAPAHAFARAATQRYIRAQSTRPKYRRRSTVRSQHILPAGFFPLYNQASLKERSEYQKKVQTGSVFPFCTFFFRFFISAPSSIHNFRMESKRERRRKHSGASFCLKILVVPGRETAYSMCCDRTVEQHRYLERVLCAPMYRCAAARARACAGAIHTVCGYTSSDKPEFYNFFIHVTAIAPGPIWHATLRDSGPSTISKPGKRSMISCFHSCASSRLHV